MKNWRRRLVLELLNQVAKKIFHTVDLILHFRDLRIFGPAE
jgi:hypothetical protein